MKKILLILLLCTLIITKNCKAHAEPQVPQYRIEIDIPSRALFLIENDTVLKKYPVAVGKPDSQTPIGNYKIVNKIINPYYSKQNIVGGSSANPLGSRWIGFKPFYGIHGNNNPKSIGTFISAGCVRMYDKDIKELYGKVKLGDPVAIKYELIKIEKDIDGLNPVIIVYPDYYSKMPNLQEKVDEKLIELNLIEKIEINKMKELKKLIRKEIVVFSEQWAYFINDNYVTNDILLIEDNMYVNVDKVCKFLNIDITNDENEDYIRVFNSYIPIVKENNNRYIPINSLEVNLGGDHKKNQSQQTIKYNLNYLLFNNKFVKGEILDIEGETLISLDALTHLLSIEGEVLNNKPNILTDGLETVSTILNDKHYISLMDLSVEIGFKFSIYTKDKYIEIFY